MIVFYYHTVGGCNSCSQVTFIAPWGEEPNCFHCSGYQILKVDEENKALECCTNEDWDNYNQDNQGG